MRRIIAPIAPLFAIALLVSMAAAARSDVQKYVCDPIHYPDGTEGVAVVRVELTAGAAAPTVTVTVDYYSANRAEHLGRFDNYDNMGGFPTNENDAHDYAMVHYYERW